ncbi:MAG: sodium:glucose symporter [Phycisphaerae bacterium SM23_30]|nr:MAG: sodium:glucose symporter [Phycisphaerae bacterium SM23_30]
MAISTFDLTVIIAYLIGIMLIGIWVGYRRHATSQQYFLAGKSLGWFSIGAALFASNISTIHLVGLAAAGADVGMVMGNFEWMASFCLIILGLVFAPFYFKSRISTLPEYLEKRYSTHARTCLAFVAIFGALLIHIGISLFAGAKLFESFLGVNVLWSILIISAVTVVYTILGGLKAVVVTETIQTFLLLGGAVLVTALGINYLPQCGVENISDFSSQLKTDQMSMIHSIRNEQGFLNEYSWLAVLLGYPVLGIWYWCSDQTIVQRVLGAKGLQHAQLGPLFAGFLKILPVFLMVFPGVIGYLMYKNGYITLPMLDNGQLDYNLTLASMINILVPQGIKGLLAAGLLAALMSTIAAALNSCATLISVDVIKRIKPDITDAKQVSIGRVSAGVVMVLAMLWSTQGDQFGTIFEAINKIPMIFAPAVTTVFLLGVFWRRGTNKAALATFAIGCSVGLIYFVMDMPVIGKSLLDNPREGFAGLVTDPVQGIGIPFMLVGPILCAMCIIIYVITSLMAPALASEKLENVCWDHPLKALTESKISGVKNPRIWALVLFIIMCVLYFFLR